MDKNKVIILALIVIIAALLVGIAAMMPNITKQDTKLKFESNSTLTDGDSLQILLTDVNGTAIANQTVNVTITDKDNSCDIHSIVTNENGIGTLKLDKTPGKYDVTINYGGNDKYNGCNASQNVDIEEKVVEAQPASTSSSSPNYDPGAFYSPQAGRVIYTGEVMDSPGGLHRHLGNNKWEPVWCENNFYQSYSKVGATSPTKFFVLALSLKKDNICGSIWLNHIFIIIF